MFTVKVGEMEQLFEIYARVKYLMLKAEQLDYEKTSMYLQPRLELCQAFDHFMVACQEASKKNADVNLTAKITTSIHTKIK